MDIDQFKEDEALWKAFKTGSEPAFGQIYRREIQGLIHYGKKLTPDTVLIQDAVQDLFLEIWNSRARLTDTDNIRFYLLRALRNKLSKKIPAPLTSEPKEEEASEPSIEFAILENEDRDSRLMRLEKALQKLSKRQQEAINLRYYHDLSNEEVARIMGVNYQSACKFIYSGLKILKDYIIFLLINSLISSIL
ncbi:MAG: sigma-70 family RNA polymerase sigma factor [Leadbetterella sp.]|nr:sigma-70 family RNA polymerase sigma factor [Leadbetterella sp.]